MPPPHSAAAAAALVLFLLSPQISLSLSCPPFPSSSPPHFPFSPPFQVHCSLPHSTLSIHNLTFSLLRLTSPTSLLLLPLTKPTSPISLSHSPFRLSPSSSLHHSLSPLIEVEWDPRQCHHCEATNGQCGFNLSDSETRFVCSRPGTRPGPNRAVVKFVIIFLIFIIGIISIASLILRSRRRRLAAVIGEDPAAVYLHRHRAASLLPPVFTYEELETATNRFDIRRKIGDGGFGSVFLGQLYDGRIVAVKHLHRGCQGGKQFLTKSFCNEILILSSIGHPNLVKLHGYCSDTRGLILVYDYVSNGSLFEHLHKRAYRKGSMMWQVRIEIALQIALAIEYLHFSVLPPIVHRDITSSNIFLEKDMRIKVGDFGLSRLLLISEKKGSDGCVWTGPQGTPGYLDPDYHRSFRLTEKSDVYSFGVVLLELVTGMKAVDQRREKREVALAEMAVGRIQMGLLSQVVDPALVAEGGGGEAAEGVAAAAELAFRCVAADKDDRPDAREVVAELRRIRSRVHEGGSRANSRASSNSMNVIVPNDGV